MKWSDVIEAEREKRYYPKLLEAVEADRRKHEVYPSHDLTLEALRATPLESVKVVMVGQDPYFNPGLATGLAFSVPDNTPIPPSLRVIYDELVDDLKVPRPTTGNLRPWAERGVLLLNASLTVRKGEVCSHAAYGWPLFVAALLRATKRLPQPVCYLAFGADARRVIETAIWYHRADSARIISVPRPAARPPVTLRGTRPFSRLAAALELCGGTMPDLRLP